MAKSKSKSKSARSSKAKNPRPKTKIPCTPTGGVRRFFFKLELLGQRHVNQFRAFSHWHHNHEADDETPKQRPRSVAAVHATIAGVEKENLLVPSHGAALTHEHIHTHNSLQPAPANKFKIALQNDDPDHPDAIIITTLDLDAPPFCCHEDLIAMSRSQLLAVADVLNAKLPSALAVNTDDDRPESWIRSEIEWVVGIRGEREKEVELEVPGAPKAVRTWSTTGSWSGAGDFDILKEVERSPPTSPSPSPLTRKSLQMSPRSARLERLAEEDEEGSESFVMVSNVGRAAKTKRAGGKAVKRRKVESAKEADVNADMDVDDHEFDLTPTAAPRTSRPRSSSAAVPNVSPTPCRVLRSHSHNLGDKPNVETAFGGSASGIKQPHRKSNAGSQAGKASKTATPRKTRSLRPLNGYRPFLAPEDGRSRASSTSTSMSTSMSANSSLWGLSTESPWSSTSIGRKRKRNVRDGEEEEEDNEMASGMRSMNMNMGKYVADMDVDVTP
jgi:hypothetical protein